MIAIGSQRDLRAVRDLPFCHVCGQIIEASDASDRDHVPPQSCFEKTDRSPPLKLRTHVACNNQNKLNDEKVGQLISARRNGSLYIGETHLQVRWLSDPTSRREYAALENLDVDGAIRRWIGGFHAALYREPLLPGTPYLVSTPLPKGSTGPSGVLIEPIRQEHRPFVHAIKQNRAARNLDTIVTNSGKLRYECVWVASDDGSKWFCVFALDLYYWISLGDAKNAEARGCVGAYMPSRVPSNASRATGLVFDFANDHPLNPFGA